MPPWSQVGYAIESKRPVLLLRELDPKKGGISFEAARSLCPPELREHAFALPHISWHRAKDFRDGRNGLEPTSSSAPHGSCVPLCQSAAQSPAIRRNVPHDVLVEYARPALRSAA